MSLFKGLKPGILKDKSKEELDKHYDKIELEKGDLPAMLIAALITFLPVTIIVALIYIAIAYLFIR